MRIIGGIYRSRSIVAPPEEITRPTSDRLRETLFNVIAAKVPGSRFLDLFAGSGAVAIEALSRGAKQVYAVELHRKAVRTVDSNLRSLGIHENFVLIAADVAHALRQLHEKFDIVFVDPPYREHGVYEAVFRQLTAADVVDTDGIVIAEHEKHFDPGDELGGFTRYRTLKQGDAVLSFYHK
jgi:16S rRNA (guanine966-N2)-methyltransferase